MAKLEDSTVKDTTKREGIFWVTRNSKGEVVGFRPTEESGYSTGPANWKK